jgi:hypothetical protein
VARYEVTMYVDWDERTAVENPEIGDLEYALKLRMMGDMGADPHIQATFGETYVRRLKGEDHTLVEPTSYH